MNISFVDMIHIKCFKLATFFIDGRFNYKKSKKIIFVKTLILVRFFLICYNVYITEKEL